MTVFIKPEDLPVMERLAASDPSETIRKRVRLLLLYEAGMKTGEIADKVDLSPGRVLYWRRQYLKAGIGVFGGAAAGLDGGEEKLETEKAKKPRKSEKDALAHVTGQAERADRKGRATDSVREVLHITLTRAEKRRKKLKKNIKGMSKKKAVRARSRLKKLDRQIKRAKKVLRKLST